MSALARIPSPAELRSARRRLHRRDRRAGRLLVGLCLVAAAVVFVVLAGIAIEVISHASASYDRFGIAFVVHRQWIPDESVFGAWTFVYGTLVTSFATLALATVIGVSIGLFLGVLAPRRLAAIIGPMVELLAAVPSIIMGFIGLILFSPAVAHAEPFLHRVLGWIPLFGPAQTTGLSLFTAVLVLTIMVVPIIAALSRDLFFTVPRELVEGAEALGATRWEVIRGVILPTTRPGVVSACVLGFGRAVGEAIAVSLVVGSLASANVNLFAAGNTAAANIANQFLDVDNDLHRASLFYLALVLLVLSVISNLVARRIGRGFAGVRA